MSDPVSTNPDQTQQATRPNLGCETDAGTEIRSCSEDGVSFIHRLKGLRRIPVLNSLLTSPLRRLLPTGRARNWCLEHLPRVGIVSITVPIGGEDSSIRLVSGDDWLTSRIYWNGPKAFEPEVLLPFLAASPRSRGTLDIGAYSGWYSLLASAANPHGKVFAFEANPIVVDALNANLRLNCAPNIQILQSAVSDVEGTARFHLGSEGLASSSSLLAEWKGLHRTIEVPTRTIDGIMESAGDPPVDLAKIDIEGAEEAAIRGMTRTIDRWAPVMIVELLRDHRERFRPVAQSLMTKGYRCYECRADELVLIDPLGDRFLDIDGINFLFSSDSSICDPDIQRLLRA